MLEPGTEEAVARPTRFVYNSPPPLLLRDTRHARATGADRQQAALLRQVLRRVYIPVVTSELTAVHTFQTTLNPHTSRHDHVLKIKQNSITSVRVLLS